MSGKAADYDGGTTPQSPSRPAPVLRSTLPFAALIDGAQDYKTMLTDFHLGALHEKHKGLKSKKCENWDLLICRGIYLIRGDLKQCGSSSLDADP